MMFFSPKIQPNVENASNFCRMYVVITWKKDLRANEYKIGYLRKTRKSIKIQLNPEASI